MTATRSFPLSAPAVALGWLLASAASAAPPTLTYLFPAGAQRGKTVEVAAGGSFERWPVRAWVDGKGVTVRAAKEKGKLSVSVAPDATPGTYWVRLYDDQGATSPRPFLVGTLPEAVEQEPNDDPRKPQVLESSCVVNGRLQRAGDVDGFAVKLRKGQTLVASVEANRVLGSPMDAVLQVLSADGFVLEENNDYHGLDPQIVFAVPADGTYVVRIFAFPAAPDATIGFAGGEQYVYRLTLTTGSFVDYPFPLAVTRSARTPVEVHGWNIPHSARKVAVPDGEPGDTALLFDPLWANTAVVRLDGHATITETEPNDRRHPQPITLPVTVSGRIEPAGDVDVYRFEAKKGQKLFFRVEARGLGSPLDPVLRLTDGAGKLITQVDDAGPGEDNRDAELSFTPPQDGTYRIEVRDLHGHGGGRYFYRLTAGGAAPDYELKLAADRLVLTPGKPLDVALTVQRHHDFTGEVRITAEGLPPGVTALPAKVTGTAGSATLRLTAATGLVSGPVRVVGNVPGAPGLRRTARAPLAGLNASTADVWLTVLGR